VAMVHNLVLCLSAAEAGARLAVWCPNLAQFLRARLICATRPSPRYGLTVARCEAAVKAL
jgi:hypothetical protein